MAQVTYDSIKPLVAKQEVKQGVVYCTFTCPETGTSADASSPIPRGDGAGNKAKAAVQGSLMVMLRRQLSRVLYSFLGGAMGRAALEIANQGLQAAGEKFAHTQEQIEEGVLGAYQKVADRFRWDPQGQRWVGALPGAGAAAAAVAPVAAAAGIAAGGGAAAAWATGPGFMERLQQAPVNEPGDRQLLARMLVEVAAADQQLAPAEQQFLGGFMGMPPQAIQQLAQQPALTPGDLAQASQGPARESLILLAWALALADQDLAAAEQSKVLAFGQGLELDPAQVENLRRCCAEQLVEQGLQQVFASGQRDEAMRQELSGLADRLGMPAERVTWLEARAKERLGLR